MKSTKDDKMGWHASRWKLNSLDKVPSEETRFVEATCVRYSRHFIKEIWFSDFTTEHRCERLRFTRVNMHSHVSSLEITLFSAYRESFVSGGGMKTRDLCIRNERRKNLEIRRLFMHTRHASGERGTAAWKMTWDFPIRHTQKTRGLRDADEKLLAWIKESGGVRFRLNRIALEQQ